MYNNSSMFPITPYIAKKVWGGGRLKELKAISNLKFEGDCVGETWEISNHHDGMSNVLGTSLIDLVDENDLPYLVKFIDTTSNLSIQVHPDDEFAQREENSSGKMECWIILDAGEDSGIFLGPKKGVDRKTFGEAVKKNEDMSSFLEFYKVKKGDFVFVPAGTLHAIGKDVLLAEVQSRSGITYRVWDWNRVGLDGTPRELHIDKAMKVANFGDTFSDKKYYRMRRDIFSVKPEVELLNEENFTLTLHNLSDIGDSLEIDLYKNSQTRVSSFVSLEGKFVLYRGDEELQVNPYQAVVFPFGGEKQLKIRVLNQGNFIFIS